MATLYCSIGLYIPRNSSQVRDSSWQRLNVISWRDGMLNGFVLLLRAHKIMMEGQDNHADTRAQEYRKLPSRWRRNAVAGAMFASVVVVVVVVVVMAGSFVSLRVSSISHKDAVAEFVLLSRAKEIPKRPASAGMRILELLSKNGSTACHHARTHGTAALGLPTDMGGIQLQIGRTFTFMLASLTVNGTRRCTGGDFYETRLVGEQWASRPPVTDNGDGTYSVTISVDRNLPGLYNFSAFLLFDNMHGLDFDPRPWGIVKEVVTLKVTLTDPEIRRTEKRAVRCRAAGGDGGGGRWTRGWYNRTCEADGDGRYRWCVDDGHAQCDAASCQGKVALLESNGWVYSTPSCAFRIRDEDEAWQCLQGRWLFFWGDSNLQDAISNLLFFILGLQPRPHTDRVSHKRYTNPRDPRQSLLISLVFNGHYEESLNGLGLASLQNATYRQRLRQLYRSVDGGPDAVIFTTGLHDAEHFASAADFAAAVDFAGDFWSRLLAADGQRRPAVVLRTAVAPAGGARARDKQANPQKMESFNAIMVEGLRRKLRRDVVHVLDAYDATFPFHFDHSYSDGVHYGREPKSGLPPWFGRPHQYFVDIMLDHMLLDCLCSHLPSPLITPGQS